MKRIVLAIAILAISAVVSPAQKKPLDHDVYDSWESISQTLVSPSGNVVAYVVQLQEGDGRLVVKTFGKKGRETVIPRGYRPTILDDEKHLVCLVKPEFQKTRKAKIAKKKDNDLPQDSLFILDLASGSIVKFPSVKSYRNGKHASDAIAFATVDTSFVLKADRKKKDMGNTVAVYHLGTGSIDTLRHIDSYALSNDGKWLGAVRKTAAKRSVTGFFNIDSRTEHFLADTTAWHGLPTFDEAGTRALFLEAKDTLDGSKHPALRLMDLGDMSVKTLLEPCTGKWGITEKCKAWFSHDGKLIYTEANQFTPPKDTTLVPFETPGLDIWNWDAPFTPPTQKYSGSRIFTPVKALYKDGALHPVAQNHIGRTISTAWENNDVVLRIEPESPIEIQWDGQAPSKVYALELSTGRRTTLTSGRAEFTRLSPDGKTAVWWDLDAREWLSGDTASGKTTSLTGSLDVIFWDEDNDVPGLPEAYGSADWILDGSILLYDRYDIWKVSLDGSSAERLTRGREKGLTYRYLRTRSEELEPGLAPDETIWMSVFDNATKENGLACMNLSKPLKSFRTEAFGGYSYRALKKAEKGKALIYTKGNFQNPMDLHYVSAPGKAEEKLSAINPQMSSYNWGSVELYKWTAYDGTPLEGLLYKPEDFSEDRKYPVMIYFYERNSETLFSWHSPAPSASIINIPFFVSRGYVVFVPDIVYHGGIPGQCAYNCIVSGAESLKAFPWIDGDNMAIQGQSWGGYQVAYLITRTGMFKAAGAGAPVSNMTSAYGGIRWESGSSRQMQYEMGQSRIGRKLWDGIGLYMENSPLFGLPNVTTPVLIMHNDADGAVPWYQGIEMFMGLRRLQKPAWLLEYNDEAHNLRERRNRKDLSIRLQQFFDHYLKGAPAPLWMTEGIPTAEKSWNFGYEYGE